MVAFLLNLIVFARAQHRGVFATTLILLYCIYYIIYGAAGYNSAYLHILFTSIIIIILYIMFVEMYPTIIFPTYIYIIYTSLCVVRMWRRWSALQSPTTTTCRYLKYLYIYVYMYMCVCIHVIINIIYIRIRPGCKRLTRYIWRVVHFSNAVNSVIYA